MKRSSVSRYKQYLTPIPPTLRTRKEP
jgi:hypothetical protein